MIKFFQKLKAKKGFTLVELIVVIAIIGVLAAILVPTMLGYVTSSRVTSADTTAGKIEEGIDTFLTSADVAGYGMKRSATAVSLITGSVAADGEWTITVGTPASFKDQDQTAWAGSATGKSSDSKTDATNPTHELAIELAKLFPDVKSICFEASLVAGDCAAVWYTADTTDVNDVTDLKSGAHITDGQWTANTFDWDTETAGVSADGYIVGTSPKLGLATQAAGT